MKKMVKNLLSIKYFIFIIPTCFYTYTSSSQSMMQDLNLPLSSLAFINNETHNGNGFFITENLLVTSYENIKNDLLNRYPNLANSKHHQLTFQGITSEPITLHISSANGNDLGKVLVIDPKNDLAIIKTFGNHYEPLTIGNELDIRKGLNALTFIIRGPPTFNKSLQGLELPLYLHEGIIELQIENKLFHSTIPMLQEAKGAPVLSTAMKVIGIVSGPPIQFKASSFHEHNRHGPYIYHTFAISINRLKHLIERYRNLLEKESGTYLGSIQSESQERNKLDQSIKTPEDMFRLALVYQNGIGGIKQDHQKAFNFFKEAARRGHAEAQFQFGRMYYYGLIGQKDFKKAFYWFKKAALKGHINAGFQVGHMYKYGKGVLQDKEQEAKWLQRAFEKEEVFCNY